MAKEELIKVIDFILNRCNEAEIEAVAAAVVHRRRDMTLFASVPNAQYPGHLAESLSSRINIKGSIDGLKKEIRDYAVRIIKQEAPELNEKQIDELCRAWLPGEEKDPARNDMLVSMIGQFVSFSLGRMEEEEDDALRAEMGPWPDKYWRSFPQVVRLLIVDFLRSGINENEFNTRIDAAMSL